MSRQCAAARAKSTILKGSTKTDAHAGAFGLTGGGLEPAAIDAELALSASPSPATTAIRCHPKVSESRSPCRHDAVGEHLVEFGESEHR
jgi:hypothetical protein